MACTEIVCKSADFFYKVNRTFPNAHIFLNTLDRNIMRDAEVRYTVQYMYVFYKYM
jgi:hypothetical protein